MGTTKKDVVAVNGPLALYLMQNNRGIKARATSYFNSIKRNLQREIIDKLIDQKDKLEQRHFDLTDMNLETNLNQGLQRMSQEDLEKRFAEAIDIEYRLELVNLELKIKQAAFDKYFG